MFIGGLLGLVFLIWMIAKIWKDSALLAVASFFFWPVLIYALVKYWSDEEHDIKIPFALFTLATIYAWYDMHQMAKALLQQEDPEALLVLLRAFA